MRRLAHILSLVLLMTTVLSFVGCRPKGVLSSKELENLLYDIHHAEAVVQLAGYNYGHEEELRKYYYQVLASHGVTQAQFDSTIVWYTAHPSRYDKIYPKVLARIDADMDNQRLADEAARGEAGKPRNVLEPFEDVLQACFHGLNVLWGVEDEDDFEPTIPFLK